MTVHVPNHRHSGFTATEPAPKAHVHDGCTTDCAVCMAPIPALDDAAMANRIATAMKVAGNLVREHVDYDTAEGYFLDHVTNGASEEQGDVLMGYLDSAYGR